MTRKTIVCEIYKECAYLKVHRDMSVFEHAKRLHALIAVYLQEISKNQLHSDRDSGILNTDAERKQWITCNGTHIPIKNGKLQGTVGNKIRQTKRNKRVFWKMNNVSEESIQNGHNTGSTETGTEEPADTRTGKSTTQGLGDVSSSERGGNSASGGGASTTGGDRSGNNRPLSGLGISDVQEVDHVEFAKRMRTVAKLNPDSGKVDAHNPREWRKSGAKLLSQEGVGSDGKTSFFGAAVKPDGDIVGVFSGVKGKSKDAMIAAIANGGNKLDAYAIDNDSGLPGKLANIYHKTGFIPVARVKFNPDHVNASDIGGEQDIVFYRHNGDTPEQVSEKYGTYPKPTREKYDQLPVMDYDAAMKFRDAQLKK
jgi:hypothetical protein